MLSKKHNFDRVFDTQKLFRILLSAISDPLTEKSLAEFSKKFTSDSIATIDGAVLALALTLLDNEVSFYSTFGQPLNDLIVSLTYSKQVNIRKADFVFIADVNELEEIIGLVKYGSLSDPHTGATLIVYCEDTAVVEVVAKGPGIDGSKTIFTKKAIVDAVLLRNEQNYEYPVGLDYLFLFDDCSFCALPRLVQPEVV